MELSEIGIGTKLELEVNTADDERQVYASQFEWLEEDDTAVIAAPIYEGKVVPLEIGTLIDVYFIKKAGRLIGLNKFSAEVRGRSIVDNLHILLVRKLGEIVRIQRRSYFRLDVLLEVRYRVVQYFDGEYDIETPYKRTLATDLSGGGLSLILEDKLEKDSIIEGEIFSGQPERISFLGRTRRCERMLTDSRYKYLAGIEFTEIGDSSRERVIRYVFNEQRKLINKGMI
jgi:c-di-GMP-binding flagellar brake protein YcgR